MKHIQKKEKEDEIPSIDTISSIMKEIDDELVLEASNEDNNDNDLKTQTLDIDIDPTIKAFICEPV